MTTNEAGAMPAPGREFALERRNRKTSELIAYDLVAYIVSEDLPAGAKLPTEKEMVESFGVGRSTLREALRLLESRGVITIRSGPGGGPVIRHPRPSDLSDELRLLLQFRHASLSDVMEARRAFEPVVARLAATRVTDAQIAMLQASVDRSMENLDDYRLFIAENQAFHSLIAEAAGSVVLEVFNESLKSLADGVAAGVVYSTRRRKAINVAHQHIVDALAARDPDLAAQMMLAHLEEGAAHWSAKFPELYSRPVRWFK